MDWELELPRAGTTVLAAGFGAWFGSKWSESRKLDARFEKLDRIREEVRDVTRAQEEIKRQILGGEWDRQWTLNQRKDAYVALASAFDEYISAELQFQTNRGANGAGTDVDRLCRASDALNRAIAVAEIFAGPTVSALLPRLNEFHDDVRRQEQTLADAAPKMLREIIACARADLGGSSHS